MNTAAVRTGSWPVETLTASVGFIFVGLGIAVTTVSSLSDMTLMIEWLAAAMLGVIVFMAAGKPLLGFPSQGCV